MSSTSQPRELYDCNYCAVQYNPHDEYQPGFCSADCFHAKLAADVLRKLTHDHRYCATCYRKLRDVIPPGRSANSSNVYGNPEEDDAAEMDAVPECATGRAYPTPDTQSGIAERLGPRNPVWNDWEYIDKGEKTRQVCACGVTHHGTIFRPISPDWALDIADHLSDAVRDLLYEGEHEHKHDYETLIECFEAVDETVVSDVKQEFFARALGRAIHRA